ncbi:hypothetical protein FBU30_004034 [Linnemannia zychae]|nr:hypothetical protein FBU30_004034 [Linnemannia zychae]
MAPDSYAQDRVIQLRTKLSEGGSMFLRGLHALASSASTLDHSHWGNSVAIVIVVGILCNNLDCDKVSTNNIVVHIGQAMAP